MEPQRIEPGPGQESVWDYPRPPRIDPTSDRIVVRLAGELVADTTAALRVLETSQPPAYYVPAGDVNLDLLLPAAGRSFCEWKGEASYHDIVVGSQRVDQGAWSYADPSPGFVLLRDHYAFYAQRLDCMVGDEAVVANEGTFYGGWITSKVVGPFKGGVGSTWW